MAHLGVADLTDLAHAAYGRDLRDVVRLHGGSKKGVYRLTLDDGTTGIAYVWRASEDYWPEHERDPLFGNASGRDLFLTAHTALSEAGASVPRLVLVDSDVIVVEDLVVEQLLQELAAEDYWPEHERDPLFGNASGRDLFLTAHTALSEAGASVPRLVLVDSDVIVVEDLGGEFLEKLLDDDPEPLDRLWDDLQAMHQRLSPRYGRPSALQPADAPPVPDVVLQRALKHLEECCARVPRIAAAHDRLEAQLRQRHSVIEPRAEYGLIHGELGPDHVLVADGRPVLIDIEGTMFFDVEWEHVFLELRFGPHHRPVAGLDPARLSLYRLAQHLSLVEGPLRLLDGDFPHRDAMREIADQNIERVLAQISR